MAVQVHAIAWGTQMTTLSATNMLLPESDATLILTPGVTDEIPKSHRT